MWMKWIMILSWSNAGILSWRSRKVITMVIGDRCDISFPGVINHLIQ
jgi:hypothetical protein